MSDKPQSQEDFIQQLREVCEERCVRMATEIPKDFTSMKDYFVNLLSQQHSLAEAGLHYTPICKYPNLTFNELQIAVTEGYGITQTAFVLALSMLPPIERAIFHEKLCKQLRADLQEELEGRIKQAQNTNSLIEQFSRFLSPGKPNKGSTH